MKYLISTITLFCFLLIGSKVKAQHPYIPIPQDSAFWISVVEDWHEGEGATQHTFSYIVNYTDGKDTLINGKWYFGYNGDIPPLIHYGNTPIDLEDWFRQDTLTKKVWKVYDQSGPDEYLLYDFSLQKGDTINDTTQFIFNRWLPYKFWVADMDSVYFPDGTWRNRWFIESNFGPDWGRPAAEVVQIEGMGYTTDFEQDPLYFYEPMIGNTYQVTCFRHNSLWLYTKLNPWNADCDSLIDHNILQGLGIQSPSKSELKLPLLYPNPVRSGGMMTLNSLAGSISEIHTVQVYNNMGILIWNTKLTPGQSFYLPNCSPGIYYFKVENEKQKLVYQQKISIQ